MAYALLSQSFGASKANLPVVIVETSTGIPAIILSSATGGLVNSNGDTVLDGSGNLSVFVDDSKTWTVNVDSGATAGPAGFLTSAQIAVGATSVAGVKSDGSLVNSAGTSIGWTAAQVAGIPVTVGTSRALTNADNGLTLECTATVTLTVPTGLVAGFGCAVIPSGTTTVASSGGTLLNGSTTSVTRTAASNNLFLIVARSAANSYVINGN